jgi:PAS domain S-box-containing protein
VKAVEILGIHDQMHTKWEKFIAAGKCNPGTIRSGIAESWIRCRQLGVNPYDVTLHPSLDAGILNRILKGKEKFIKIAKPFMDNVYRFVKGSGFVVVLTDENGYILEMFCDEGTKQNPMTQNFFRGACWQEGEMGTNAIGLALANREPVQVSGAEHYCQKHHCLTCSAAPIFDTHGSIIGVLDMSGASHATHLHTLGMVAAAAEAIMAQLRIQQKNQELALVNDRLRNFFNAVSDGVLIVDKQEVVIELNPAAKEMLGKAGQNILGTAVNRLFDYKSSPYGKKLSINEPCSDVEIMVETKDGLCHCLASGMPVINEQGVVTSGIIILRPIKQVQKLVNRLSGYSATLQFSDIVGESVEIREVIRLATLTATTTANILLQGESGTGKEIFAQAIHNRSAQQSGPFIALNCGAIPRELIGSELFGYEEGAFTGAKRGGKLGKFELASGGTLFLDEIGDMPLEQQIALLRVIQEKKVARIGSDKMIPVNVRLICATNKNLLQEVERGAFRQDLFYRLNVMSITLPPLRNRVGDIPLLFGRFLEKLCRDWGCNFHVEPEVFDSLKRYGWPGNVRELQNVVERAASLAEKGIISLRHLPVELCAPSANFQLVSVSQPVQVLECREERRKIARNAEKQKILMLLDRHAGNVSQVARELGVSRKTLYNKMHLYAIKN